MYTGDWVGETLGKLHSPGRIARSPDRPVDHRLDVLVGDKRRGRELTRERPVEQDDVAEGLAERECGALVAAQDRAALSYPQRPVRGGFLRAPGWTTVK